MALIVAIVIVGMTVNHAFKGTNPVAFIGDLIGVAILASLFGGC